MADQVLYSGVALDHRPYGEAGLINSTSPRARRDARDGQGVMGTGEASGDKRALMAAEGGDRQSAHRRQCR